MKKIVSIVTFVLIAGLIWYLFLKPADYIIRFNANTFPGAINQTLKLWDKSVTTAESISQQDLYNLTQQIKVGDSIHYYNWEIEALTDSTSRVIVGIKDANLGNSIFNRIQVPFSKTAFTANAERQVLDLMENLKDHTEKFRVEILGEAELPSKYLAYIPLKVTQFQKLVV